MGDMKLRGGACKTLPATGGNMSTSVGQLLEYKGRHVWSLEPSATVRDAVNLFGDREIGAVLICDGGQVLGVVSERDCVRRVLWKGECGLESCLRDVMREFSAVTPRDSIEHCMSLMNDRRARHLPVIDQGQVVGVISIGDVINAMVRDQRYLIESLESYITGSPSVRPPAH
jgi:CBS domain-containing protein